MVRFGDRISVHVPSASFASTTQRFKARLFEYERPGIHGHIGPRTGHRPHEKAARLRPLITDRMIELWSVET